MREIIACSLLFLNIGICVSGELSLDKLQDMHTSDWVEIGDYLEKQGWIQTCSSNSKDVSSVGWQSQDGYSLLYERNNDTTAIVYNTSREDFLHIKESMYSLGYVKNDSRIENGRTCICFKNSVAFIQTIQQTNQGENSYYIVCSSFPIKLQNRWFTLALNEENNKEKMLRPIHGQMRRSGSSQRWDLAGRQIVGTLPRPSYTANEQGYVVVNITVDSDGNVVGAEIGKCVGITASSLRNAALQAAKKAKFSKHEGRINQKGTISYYFTLQ